MRKRRNNGFTVIELLEVLFIMGMLVVVIFGIIIGNFWYSNDGVLRELKADHPAVTEILKTKTSVFAKSVITVKEDGAHHDYCLNTDIFWNYEFSECEK